MKTTSFEVMQAINAGLRDPSRIFRDEYLGMSTIGGCPYEAYQSFFDPPETDALRWYNWAGYMIEDSILTMLQMNGLELDESRTQEELIADFDDRYRGHVDGVTTDDILLEVKSINWSGFNKVREREQAAPRNYDQVQAYLTHGCYQGAVIIYVCRDVKYYAWTEGPTWAYYDREIGNFIGFYALDIEPDTPRQDYLDNKAKMILAAIDAKTPPQPYPDGHWKW